MRTPRRFQGGCRNTSSPSARAPQGRLRLHANTRPHQSPFRRARVEGAGLPVLPNALGYYEGDGSVWVQQAWLRDQAGRYTDAAWMAGFDAMVAYARGKGWVTPGNGAIRAHIERA